MSTFIDYLKKHIGKRISIYLDDDQNTLNNYEVVDVGEDYLTVIHGSVNRTIPVSKITYIQEMEN